MSVQAYMLLNFHKAWQHDAVCFFGSNLMGMPNRQWRPPIFKFPRDLCEQAFAEQLPSI